jgi:SAM-dependent methyltransferase
LRWRRLAAARIVEVLGGPPAAVIEATRWGVWCGREGREPGARCSPHALPLASGAHRAIALCFVGYPPCAAARAALLAEVLRALQTDGRLAILDHNRPRRLPAALRALGAWPWLPGWTPRARWRRLGYPTAREAAAAGFAVEALRLLHAERVQLVLARRR